MARCRSSHRPRRTTDVFAILTNQATSFGERDTGYVAMVFSPRDRARRALVDRERVGAWTWREATCRSMAELRALRADDNLRFS